MTDTKNTTKEEKIAYSNGVSDKLNGHKNAIGPCRKMADTNKMAAAYVRGYDCSGSEDK